MTAGSRAWRDGRVVLGAGGGVATAGATVTDDSTIASGVASTGTSTSAASGSVRNDIGATEVSAEPGTSAPMLPMKPA